MKKIFDELHSLNTYFSNVKGVFEISILDKEGLRHFLFSKDFCCEKYEGKYIFENNAIFNGRVIISSYNKNDGLDFRIDVINNSDFIIESVKFPIVRIPCKMKGDGGDTLLFWPSMEGTLIEQANNKYYSNAIERGGPGYTGLTPGGSAMQFMAVYSEQNGFYLGTHDENCNFKDFEYYFEDNDILRLECTHYISCSKNFILPYDIVVREFKGDWQDAADIYREWFRSSNMQLPPKLAERKDLPSWIFDSPIPLIYPIRGETDKDCDNEMTENCYYPYSNILSVVDYYAEKLDSRIMPLIMHWEGSAPWANPYIWPPYGDINDFEYTVKELHKKGHLIGLYASGIGITTQSVKDSSYNNEKGYRDENWSDSTCRDNENNEVAVSALSFVRDGYEICPYCEQTKRVTVEEAVKVAKADVDYFQAFDQNIGGVPHFCWSKKHGHPNTPGKWLIDSMESMMSDINNAIHKNGKQMLFGCELAACEPMLKHLTFNDLRWFTTLRQGRPVRAYNYLYHEYTCNFMGNQNGLEIMIDFSATPDNLLYRLAYSFLAGDMLAVVLGNKGRLSWGWNAPFDEAVQNEDLLIEFIKNANKWRKSFAKKYLYYGELLKSTPVDCESSVAFVTLKGYNITDNVILNQRFRATDGTIAEFFVNRTFFPQELFFERNREGILYISPYEFTQVPEKIVLEPSGICCVIKTGNTLK